MTPVISASSSLPLNSATHAESSQRPRRIHPLQKFLRWLGLAVLLATGAAKAQNLDCVCLGQQSVLFTNGCVGVIPNLCSVVSNCWFPGTFTSFTCFQNPPAGTVTTSNIFISFTLFAQPGNVPFPCGNLKYTVGFTTNRFTLICPTNQIVPCNTTNFTFYGPSGWTNVPPCCTNTPIISGPFIVTNWPVLTATWIGQVCGVVDVCQESIAFGGPPPSSCPCLSLICPSNIVIQTCLNSTAGTGFTNVFYPLPVVSNTCIGTITNLVMIPPPGSPFPLGTNTVSCTVYDNLGNSATCSFNVIVLGDTTPPVVTCGPNQTIQCGSPWSPIPPTAFDLCCPPGSLNIMLLGAVTNISTGCLESIDFIWHVNDCNGNFANCTNNVTIIDTTPPVIACNSNQVYQCGNTAGLPGGGIWPPIPPTATDNCCLAVTVSLVNVVTNSTATCNQSYTFVWQATDCCTNSAFCAETITLVDTNPPVLICGTNKVVECGSGWTFDPPLAFDACCGTNITINILSNVTVFTSTCTNIYERYWMATDCCTNSSPICSQRVMEIDSTPPVLTCASNLTIQCGSPFIFTPPTAFDACCPTSSIAVIVFGTATNTLANCVTVVTRVWQATDCCGNSVKCGQSITIVDTVPPVITCGPNQTVQCGTPWTFNPPTATDNCCLPSTGGTFLFATATNTTGPCSDTITAIWKAVDCCGNSAFCTNFVNVIDTIPPVITCSATIAIVQCGTPIIPPPATDACCPTVTLSVLSSVTNVINSCRYFVTNTWLATDCCTNTASCVETIMITDITPPVLTCASNLNLTCGTPWSFTPPTAIDLCCGTNVTLSITSTTTNVVGCTITHVRTWQAVDCCTNIATCSQVVIVSDTAPPVATCAPNKTVQCGTGWTFDAPTAIDACCGTNVTITVQFTTPPFGTPCSQTTTRQWLISDCCGNSVTCAQTVTIVDTVPPTISCPPSFSAATGSPWTFGTPTASDACCLAGITVMSTTTNVLPGCLVVHTRTWRAQDCCGNLSPLCSQSVYVSTTPPPNDLCQNPISLVINAPYLCGSNICATPSAPPVLVPTPCGASANTPDVWYTVTALCTGPMAIDTCQPCFPNPTFDTVLSAYTYTNNCAVLYQVPVTGTFTSCNDDSGPSGPCPWTLRSYIQFQAIAGQSYRIRVSGFAGATGWFTIRATQSTTAPVNDLCVNAIPVTVGNPAACGSTLCGATPTPGGNLFPTPCGASANTPDVWYRFTPTCSGVVTMDTCGTCPPAGTFDTVLSVYTGTCPGPLNQVAGACNDDSGPFGPCPWTLQSFVSFNATAGVTYYIRVSGWNLATGNFRLNINQTFTPPVNDLCTSATTVTAGTWPWNNCGANNIGPGSPCGISADVWFRYTPSCSGTIMVNTCLSSINTVLAVYSGPNCGALTFVGCNDDAAAGSCAGSQQSYMTFAGVAGTTYYIRVGGFGGAMGGGVLNIVGPNPPANTCPPAVGVSSCRVFQVLGPGVGTSWAWSISSPCCANLQNLFTPGVVGSPAVLATAFANSINAVCPGTAFSIGPFLIVCLKCGPTAPVTLAVGPAGTLPLNLCVVGGSGLPTTGLCSFNPEIVEAPMTGHDANNNGLDDYIDIVTGTSADVNGNLIPDETETCFGPQVTAKPESQLVEPGQNVTLSVAVSGTPPFSYQWLLNGQPIPGATSSNLTINPVTTNNLGAYSVTVSNNCGSLEGTAADIFVQPTYLPVLTDANLTDGWFRFMVETKIGFNYVIEYKNNINDPAWMPLTNAPGIGAPQFIYDGEPPPQQRFYRVIQRPAP